MQELDAGVRGRELPVHGRAQGVAVLPLGLDLGLRAMYGHQIAQDGGEIQLGAPHRELDRAPTLLGCSDQEQVAHPLVPVQGARASPTPAACWSRPRRPPGNGRPRGAGHPPCCARRRHWPAGGCTSIVSATASTRFLRARRAVSGVIESITSRPTSSVASSFSAQRARPGGGVEDEEQFAHGCDECHLPGPAAPAQAGVEVADGGQVTWQPDASSRDEYSFAPARKNRFEHTALAWP